jgi:hypothetical protein
MGGFAYQLIITDKFNFISGLIFNNYDQKNIFKLTYFHFGIL